MQAGYTHRYSAPGKGVVRGYARALADLKAAVEYGGPGLYSTAICTSGKILVQDRLGGDVFFFATSTAELDEHCTTEHLPYDLTVCCCLLLLSAHIPGFRINSSGFPCILGGQFDENWLKAFEWVKGRGYSVRIEQQGKVTDGQAVDTTVIVRPVDVKA